MPLSFMPVAPRRTAGSVIQLAAQLAPGGGEHPSSKYRPEWRAYPNGAGRIAAEGPSSTDSKLKYRTEIAAKSQQAQSCSSRAF